MPNPFEEPYSSNNYTTFVSNQILTIQVGESKKVDVGVKCANSFRMSIRYISLKQRPVIKFTTKTTPEGELWIKRIK